MPPKIGFILLLKCLSHSLIVPTCLLTLVLILIIYMWISFLCAQLIDFWGSKYFIEYCSYLSPTLGHFLSCFERGFFSKREGMKNFLFQKYHWVKNLSTKYYQQKKRNKKIVEAKLAYNDFKTYYLHIEVGVGKLDVRQIVHVCPISFKQKANYLL